MNSKNIRQAAIDKWCLNLENIIFSARCNIYISRLCYDVSVRLWRKCIGAL